MTKKFFFFKALIRPPRECDIWWAKTDSFEVKTARHFIRKRPLSDFSNVNCENKCGPKHCFQAEALWTSPTKRKIADGGKFSTSSIDLSENSGPKVGTEQC